MFSGQKSSRAKPLNGTCQNVLFVALLLLIPVFASCRLRRNDQPPPAASASASSSPPAASSASAPALASALAPPACSSAAAPNEDPDGPAGAVVIGIGGIGSSEKLSPTVLDAVRAGVSALGEKRDPADAAAEGVAVLENNTDFNAGRGSAIRFDGSSIEMDAAVMDSRGRLGIVASIERVQNPILVARQVADLPDPIIVGTGAIGFARSKGFAEADLATPLAKQQRDHVLHRLGPLPEEAFQDAGSDSGLPAEADADGAAVGAFDPQPSGSVAVLVRTPDGVFVVAASAGGRPGSLPGHVGAVAIPGAGACVGHQGAVAVTGPDELLVRQMFARLVYDQMTKTGSPRRAVAWALARLPKDVQLGLVAIDRRTFHVDARGPMAWASWTSDGEELAKLPDGGAP